MRALSGNRDSEVLSDAGVHGMTDLKEGVMRFAEHLDLTASQSPEGVGRAVVALAEDPGRLALTGQILDVAAPAARCRIDVSR